MVWAEISQMFHAVECKLFLAGLVLTLFCFSPPIKLPEFLLIRESSQPGTHLAACSRMWMSGKETWIRQMGRRRKGVADGASRGPRWLAARSSVELGT